MWKVAHASLAFTAFSFDPSNCVAPTDVTSCRLSDFDLSCRHSHSAMPSWFQVLVAAALVASVGAVTDEFSAWADAHGKSYVTPEEFNYRREVFLANLDRMQEASRMTATADGARFAPNKFSDLTADEFKQKYRRGYKPAAGQAAKSTLGDTAGTFAVGNVTKIDWREQGAVTPVYDQGQCGYGPAARCDRFRVLAGRTGCMSLSVAVQLLLGGFRDPDYRVAVVHPEARPSHAALVLPPPP